MKIRLYKDSVRLRLSPGEVQKLAMGETINETFQWGQTTKLIFELIPGEDIKLHSTPDKSTWQIIWKEKELQEWSDSEDVGIYKDISGDGNKLIKVSIEKDFACTGREGEEEKDRFPNPNTKAC